MDVMREFEKLHAECIRLRDELEHRDKQNEELFKENKELEAKLTWAEGERDAYYISHLNYHHLKRKYENLLKRMEKYEIIIDAVEKLCGCEFDI